MGNTGSLPHDVHYVVIGGGYAGVTCGRLLQKEGVRFTLINETDHFQLNTAALRAVVIKGYVKKTLLPLREIFGANFKKGKIVNLDTKEKKVILEDGQEVGFDVLVIATGSCSRFPCKIQGQDLNTVCKMYDTLAIKVDKAKRILIIGGGPSGVELACEIASQYPDKQLTIVTSGYKLVPQLPSSRIQAKLDDTLNHLNIKLVKGDRINMDEIPEVLEMEDSRTVVTEKGISLKVDLILRCTGLVINSEAYKQSFLRIVDIDGQLKVDSFLQVSGYDNIYAIGDCNTCPEKLAYAAVEQAKLLISNLKRKHAGYEMLPWKPEKYMRVKLMLALGPKTGLGQTRHGVLVPEWIVRHAKSKDLMVPRFWKAAGLTEPPFTSSL